MEASRDISRLIEIMARLRDPETGCPWDVEQDFSSIAPYTIEEAYEVADAIERDDMIDLKEELGDLLLQPVYHAQLAAEAGLFDFDDVVLGITQKLLRRHPHVFGDEDARKAKSAKHVWERIKAEEAAEKAAERKALGQEVRSASMLDNVPGVLPALTRAEKLQTKAAKVGFDWPDLQPVMDKIEEEWDELGAEIEKQDTSNAARIAEEFGDFLFSVVNLGRHLGINPEHALRQTNAKFVRRFQHIEETLSAEKRDIETASLEEMEEIWQSAKGVVG
ncbi:nucleoside triphosphate pyrophosphohydrolase [Pararhizobium sp. IMCC21322]|uniref:nucleoside triphosphate pyrophosphohydrolase n=1 Tax=Pararhizobium sp. IMCC21322 TaxID=3067903 RepID=UPI00274236B7|nr:nucleoside triphosphate pyrophosphohydrolase [Pararhizobium sp. IMCC21322]